MYNHMNVIPPQCSLTFRHCVLSTIHHGYEAKIFRKGQLFARGRKNSPENRSSRTEVMWVAPLQVARVYAYRGKVFRHADCQVYSARRNLMLFAITRTNLKKLDVHLKDSFYDTGDKLIYVSDKSHTLARTLGDILSKLGFDGWIIDPADVIRPGGHAFHSEICLFPGFSQKIHLEGMCQHDSQRILKY